MGIENKKPEKPVKPVTVRIKEFKENLSKVVAEAELPPFLLETYLGEMYMSMNNVARMECEQDQEEWKKAWEEYEQLREAWKKDHKEGEKDG